MCKLVPHRCSHASISLSFKYQRNYGPSKGGKGGTSSNGTTHHITTPISQHGFIEGRYIFYNLWQAFGYWSAERQGVYCPFILAFDSMSRLCQNMFHKHVHSAKTH